jgi:hypothetical protein
MAVLGSTTLTGCSSIPGFIPTGTLWVFQQTSAPTSWTKQTTHNDKALRVVSGTASSGGTTAFSAVFTTRTITGSVGSYTLLTADIPIHTHPNGAAFRNIYGGPGAAAVPANTGATGGSGSHTHPFVGYSEDFAVTYVDVIIASKN